MTSYSFGILFEKVTYAFRGGHVVPLPDFDKVKEWLSLYGHNDGFLYPPLTRMVAEGGGAIPRSERPAHLHRLPPSHVLGLEFAAPPDDRLRSHASFVIHLLGYLHDTYVQFNDWWVDTRIPLGEKRRNSFSKRTAEDFISHAYETWRNWPVREQKRFTNILFMLNRAPSYEWDWEHFFLEYMVLDSCYKTVEALGRHGKSPTHGKRIRFLCDTFDLAKDDARIKEIVRLRNDLYHEALWDGAQPCTAASLPALCTPHELRRFNRRLILALLGYHNDYMRSPWWSGGCMRFDPP